MATLSRSTPVIAVSGLHRGESPQPGGAVIESVRAFWPEARFVGISYDPMETGLYNRGPDHVDGAYLFPFPGAGADQLKARLMEVHEREGLSLVIPTLDSELANYLAIREDLKAHGIAVAVPGRAGLDARSKTELEKLGSRAGVPVPRTHASDSAAGLAACAARLGYPCYVKGSIYDARLVYNEAQLTDAFNDIAAVWGTPVLVQEAVHGEEYDVCAIGDGAGGLVASIAIRKLMKSRMGKGFGGVTVTDPEIAGIAERLVRDLNWKGALEIELVKPVGRGHMLFEINPRFPAWVSFPAKLGLNMPAWVAADALGLNGPELRAPDAGHVFLRHCEDILAHVDDIADMLIDRNNRNRIGAAAPGAHPVAQERAS